MKSELDFAAPMADPIEEEAIAWFARVHSDQRTRADEDRFALWIEQDERHSRAYLRVQDLWRAAGPQITPAPLPATGEGGTTKWGVREKQGERSESYSSPQARDSERGQRLRTRVLAVAATLVMAVGGALFFVSRERPISQGSFATATGIQQELKLSDGSTVTLNTSSEVSIDLNKDRRTIRLARGEARFNVAKDAVRPFIVEVAGARIQALGTAFDVRLSPARIAVTLIDGKVAVTTPLPATGEGGTTEWGVRAKGKRKWPDSNPQARDSEHGTASNANPSPGTGEGGTTKWGMREGASETKLSNPQNRTAGEISFPQGSDTSRGNNSVILTPGQQLTITNCAGCDSDERRIEAVNLDKANAWLNRQLIFDAVPLVDAVEEANRYLPNPIVIRDPELNGIRVSGVVRAGSPESLIGSLESSFPIKALETPSGTALIQKN